MSQRRLVRFIAGRAARYLLTLAAGGGGEEPPAVPDNALTLDGAYLQLDGAYLTLG